MASQGKPSKGKLIIAALGVVLIILGVLWMAVIMPALTKLPGDLNTTVNLVGNMTLMDQATGQLGTPLI